MGITEDQISAGQWRELRAIRERQEAPLSTRIVIPDNIVAYTISRRQPNALPVALLDGFQMVGDKNSEIFIDDPLGKATSLLRFHRNDENEIVSVSSQYDRRLVASLLEKAMPEEYFRQLSASLAGTSLDLRITDEERRQCEACNREYQQFVMHGRQLADEARKRPEGDIPKRGIDHVQQLKQPGTCAFLSEDADALQVKGAWENIAVAAYNPIEKRAGMFYLDAKTSDKQIEDFLSNMQGAGGDSIVLHVAGGMFTDNTLMSRLLDRIDRNRDTLNLATFCPFSEYGSLTICKDGATYRDMPAYVPPQVEKPVLQPVTNGQKPEGKDTPLPVVAKPLSQNEAVQALQQYGMTEAGQATGNGLLSAPAQRSGRGHSPA